MCFHQRAVIKCEKLERQAVTRKRTKLKLLLRSNNNLVSVHHLRARCARAYTCLHSCFNVVAIGDKSGNDGERLVHISLVPFIYYSLIKPLFKLFYLRFEYWTDSMTTEDIMKKRDRANIQNIIVYVCASRSNLLKYHKVYFFTFLSLVHSRDYFISISLLFARNTVVISRCKTKIK